MKLDDLAPPGSSSYTSKTMHVGDGTWDKTTNTFLLPNLQGLNFATMRYNGMANRFKGESEYHTLILGHGILAAIAFMLIMPVSGIMARFGSDFPGGRISFKTHVYAQIIIVFLSTIILVLGWFAVGPARSLSNPHHGIGVAIYVLILFQFLYATCWFRRERRRTTPPRRLPITVFLHRLLGRATAVLAFIEIALGLTLYGSPKYLFILYTLVGVFYLVVYLGLYYHYLPREDGSRPGPARSEYYQSDYGSAISGSALPPPQQRREHHWGRDLLAAGGMIGAYEWYKNKRDRRREERDEKHGDGYDDTYRPQSGGGPPGPPYGPVPADGAHLGPSSGAPPVAGAVGAAGPRRPISQSGISRDSWEDDKYSERHARPTFGTRVMEATGAFAAYEGVRGFFNRRKGRREDDAYDGSYGSALGGNRPIDSDVSRVQAGDAPMSPDTPRVDMGGPQPMTPTQTPSRPPRNANFAAASMSNDSRYDQRPRPLLEDGAPLSEHVRELGPIAGVREWNRQRRARREAGRAEDVRRQELENEESFNRRNSNHYPRPQDASNRRMSNSGTLMTGPSAPGASDMSRANTRPDTSHPPLPAEAGYTLPPPPPGPPPSGLRSDGYGSQPAFGSAQMPSGGVEPDPRRLLRDNTAANESSAYGRDPPVRNDVVGAAAAGAVAGIAANALRGQSHSPSRGQDSRTRLQRESRRGSATTASVSNNALPYPTRPDNPSSPPVSVQVKMHNDGRHVTLRRLNDEEAAAGREARRQDRRRRRASSLSSDGEAGPPLGQRYRRDGGSGGVRSSSQQPITNVPPPPAMSSSAGASFRQQSQQTLPPAPSGRPMPQQYSSPPPNQGFSPATAPVNESGMGYATDAGTGTDVSAFADNRRRRRAERARRLEAAGGNRGSELD